MADDFDEKPAEKPDVKEYWALLRRRYWHLIVPLFLGWSAVFALSWLLPAVYRSGTVILVEQPRVPQQYVVPVVTSDLQQRLDSITQQILSRTRLEGIIKKLNLYSADQGSKTPEDLVERMRKDIDVELVRSTGDKQVTSFNVYYSSSDPHLAQQVTSELTGLFIRENLESRRQQAEQTTQFLQSQLEDARRSLAEQEERLRRYKDQYLGELPGQLQSNIQILSGLQGQLQGEQDALGRAKQQNTYLQSLLSQYQSVERSVNAGGGNVPMGLPAIDQELDRLRAQLADLSSHYTERHPDVRKLKEQIAKTERMKEKITTELKDKATTPQKSGLDNAETPNYGDTREMAAMAEMRSQLDANQMEIANRQRAIKELETRVGDYQSRLNRTPVREQQLADITRDYDQSRSNYESLLGKKNQSELATALENEQEGETFRVIDPPSLPAKPYSPDRFKMACIGLFVGLVFGVAAAGGAEFVDDRIYKEAEIKKLVPTEVLVEIPPILTVADEQGQTRSNWLVLSTSSLVLLFILAGTAFSYLKG
jgi:polysaccharide chain length determinant protein (PEP-CTERM system associated)